jgi:hypothetical protein
VELREPFSYDAVYQLTGIRWKHTLSPGIYSAFREDSDGIYHQGPSNCLNSKVLDAGRTLKPSVLDEIRVTDCGIYVPNDPSQPAKVYVIVGSQRIMRSSGEVPQTATDANPVPALNAAVAPPPAVPTPTQAAGVGIGYGIASGIVEAEKGNVDFARDQPGGISLRAALIVHPPK